MYLITLPINKSATAPRKTYLTAANECLKIDLNNICLAIRLLVVWQTALLQINLFHD